MLFQQSAQSKLKSFIKPAIRVYCCLGFLLLVLLMISITSAQGESVLGGGGLWHTAGGTVAHSRGDCGTQQGGLWHTAGGTVAHSRGACRTNLTWHV